MESSIRVMSRIRTSAALHNWRFLLCAVLGVLAALFAGVSQGPLHGHLATWEHSTPASVNSVQAESTVIASQHHSATTADSSQCSTCLDGVHSTVCACLTAGNSVQSSSTSKYLAKKVRHSNTAQDSPVPGAHLLTGDSIGVWSVPDIEGA